MVGLPAGPACDPCLHLFVTPPGLRSATPCISTAVALWITEAGNAVPLCESCLNHWCDNADDEPDLEAAELLWFASGPDQ